MKTALPYKRELYRLWFEYLRLARSSEDKTVKVALAESTSFYAPWGNVENVRFDVWWKDHRKLFEDVETVRRLNRGEWPLGQNILVVQIPMTQAPTELARQVKSIIQEAFTETEHLSKKSKKRSQSKYHPTEGAEPKLLAVRESLTVYRDVRLKYPKLRGQSFIDEVRAFYLRRKNKRWAKIPSSLSSVGYGGEARAQRNLLRYIERAKAIMLNVANGDFPGQY